MYRLAFSSRCCFVYGAAVMMCLVLCLRSVSAQATAAEDFQALSIIQLEEKIEAPDFTLTTTAGETLRLSDLKGKVVLVNFWATW